MGFFVVGFELFSWDCGDEVVCFFDVVWCVLVDCFEWAFDWVGLAFWPYFVCAWFYVRAFGFLRDWYFFFGVGRDPVVVGFAVVFCFWWAFWCFVFVGGSFIWIRRYVFLGVCDDIVRVDVFWWVVFAEFCVFWLCVFGGELSSWLWWGGVAGFFVVVVD